MGSILVEVRKGLIDALSDLPEFEDVECEFAFKVGSKARRKVMTNRARFSHTSASLRATKTFRDERGMFDLVIRVEGVATSPYDTSVEARILGHAAEDWIATHANWNNNALATGLNWLAIEGDGQFAEAFNDKGTLVELTYPVTYQARLT